MSEEIVTGLSRFWYLKVLARAADQTVTARYVISGSLRQSGSQLRLAVQLVDTISGAHLWAETYDRPFRAEDVFPLQDDLVPRIVSTVADWYGVLPQSMSEVLRLKPADQLTPYEAVLRSFGYGERRTPEEHATARTVLERAVQQAPGYADGWALLSIMCTEEYATGFNLQPDPLGVRSTRPDKRPTPHHRMRSPTSPWPARDSSARSSRRSGLPRIGPLRSTHWTEALSRRWAC